MIASARARVCLCVRAVLWTAFSPLRPTSSASFMSPGTHCPTDRLLSVTTYVLVSRWDTAVLRTASSPLRRPQHRAGPQVGHCSPTDRLLSVTTSSTPCRSPGGTMQSYGPPPLRYDVLNTVQVSKWDNAVLQDRLLPFLRLPQHRAGLQARH